MFLRVLFKARGYITSVKNQRWFFNKIRARTAFQGIYICRHLLLTPFLISLCRKYKILSLLAALLMLILHKSKLIIKKQLKKFHCFCAAKVQTIIIQFLAHWFLKKISGNCNNEKFFVTYIRADSIKRWYSLLISTDLDALFSNPCKKILEFSHPARQCNKLFFLNVTSK